MLAVIALFLSWAVGRALYRWVLRRSVAPLFAGKTALLPEWVVREPISWISGTLALGWVVYLASWLNQSAEQPLLTGNLAGGLVSLLVVGIAWRWRANDEAHRPETTRASLWVPAVLLGTVGLGFFLLCRQAIWVEDGRVGAGLSVFSDYGPHLAVMRSFSLGHNFPTEYPHFPDGSARYHFFFQFWAGNLEYLGLPLDWALNLPSVLAFLSASALLYALGVCLSQSVAGGALTVTLFFFRSGMAVWDFINAGDGWRTAWTRLLTNDQFIGRTRHEDWGLWNQNVYLNQRHLALGLSVAFFALLHGYVKLAMGPEPRLRWGGWVAKAGWVPASTSSWVAAVGLGALIGACGFWNGATVIGSLLMLAVVALFSPHRLEWLTVAAVAGVLCLAENRFFLKPGELAVAPEIVLGFLSDGEVGVRSIAKYLFDLLALQPVLVVVSVVGCAATAFARKSPEDRGSVRGRPCVWFLVFVAPLVLAFTVRLTPDIAINHKYVMISVALLNIFVAVLAVALWRMAVLFRPLAIAVIVVTTATGVVDLFTIVNKNQHDRCITADLRDPVHLWLVANTKPTDHLLTDWYSFHTVLLTGRKIFYGWPYYAWGAGYDTRGRENLVKEVYGGTDFARTLRILRQHKIAFVLIDDGNRRSELYAVKEALLREKLEVVFEHRDTVILRVPIE